jgi:hypothetical protein
MKEKVMENSERLYSGWGITLLEGFLASLPRSFAMSTVKQKTSQWRSVA